MHKNLYRYIDISQTNSRKLVRNRVTELDWREESKLRRRKFRAVTMDERKWIVL